MPMETIEYGYECEEEVYILYQNYYYLLIFLNKYEKIFKWIEKYTTTRAETKKKTFNCKDIREGNMIINETIIDIVIAQMILDGFVTKSDICSSKRSRKPEYNFNIERQISNKELTIASSTYNDNDNSKTRHNSYDGDVNNNHSNDNNKNNNNKESNNNNSDDNVNVQTESEDESICFAG